MLVSNRLESPADRADRHTGDLSLVTRASPPRQRRGGRAGQFRGAGPGEQTAESDSGYRAETSEGQSHGADPAAPG